MTTKIIYRTKLQIEFLEKYIQNGGNATKAWEDTHPKCNHHSAKQQGYQMMQKLDLSLTELFDRMGITDGRLTKKLEEGLDAKKVLSILPIPKDKRDRSLHSDQPRLKFIDVPDMGVRVKYLDMAFRLKDKFPTNKSIDSIALSFAALMKAKEKQEASG
ncbi:MAG: hypothetical protein Q8L68_04835 [Methylococcales bacterium]|nr:hypothetical protein [Methylococcales bacterium]